MSDLVARSPIPKCATCNDTGVLSTTEYHGVRYVTHCACGVSPDPKPTDELLSKETL